MIPIVESRLCSSEQRLTAFSFLVVCDRRSRRMREYTQMFYDGYQCLKGTYMYYLPNWPRIDNSICNQQQVFYTSIK